VKRITGRCLWALILLTTATSGLHASILKPVEREQLRVVGAGQLTWWGMTVYDAALLAPGGTYNADHPHAIKITYRFGFSQEQLAQKSLEEIERIHGRMADRAATLEVLKAVFRDVAKGDHILGIHYPGQGAEFYSDDRPLGRIEDAALAAAFFSIWLDPATREPGLRAQMLGYRQ
jgi:hypothetical protein